jgi:hypothetical protein
MEITIVTKQAGTYFTAAAFIGNALAGSATCQSKEEASRQARAFAQTLLDRGQPLQPLDVARLGAGAKLPTFGLVVNIGRHPRGVVQAAMLAAALLPEAEVLAA